MIRGERTSLRPASDDDLDQLVGWLADPEVYRWWEGRPLSRDEVADVYTGHRRPEVEPFIIEADGVPVGYLQVWQGTETSGGIDLFLVPEARGRGLGPDAARAAASFLLDHRGWSEVTVDPVVDNLRAIRAFERAGFSSQSEELDDETGKRVLRMFARREVSDG
ncbi:MAG TPA: GNAT family N-acetyltransferase [Actinomycetota bacterium]|nr:GNAT family N-acetyltransferase [Actinomycetota bacterium]